MNPKKLELHNRTFEKAVAPCSCCGMAPEQAQDNDPDWDTYRAGLCDSDGIYFSYLCYHPRAGNCLEDIAKEVHERRQADMNAADAEPGLPDGPELRQHKADTLREVLGDDEDGIWAEMTD